AQSRAWPAAPLHSRLPSRDPGRPQPCRTRWYTGRVVELLPSILSADFARLADAVAAAERGGGTVIHVDVMDGHFVPNITLGPPVVKSLRRVTELPLDCHLMIENPDDFIPAFAEAGANWVGVHYEACVHLHRTIEHIRDH